MTATEITELLKQDNIYCHISTTLNFDGNFIPRIPDCRNEDEDATINRVCVAKTIEGALAAIPNGGCRLEYYSDEEYIFKLFLIDINKLNIAEKHILSSEYLYETELVPDALITNEYWITSDFTVPKEDAYFIKLLTWGQESHDLIPYHIVTMGETEYDGDIYEAFEDFLGHSNFPCITTISNLNFISNHLNKGDSFTIESDHILDFQLDTFKSKFSTLDFQLDTFDIEIKAVEDTDITSLLKDIWDNLIGVYE